MKVHIDVDVNCLISSNGPNVFCRRLACELMSLGHTVVMNGRKGGRPVLISINSALASMDEGFAAALEQLRRGA